MDEKARKTLYAAILVTLQTLVSVGFLITALILAGRGLLK